MTARFLGLFVILIGVGTGLAADNVALCVVSGVVGAGFYALGSRGDGDGGEGGGRRR